MNEFWMWFWRPIAEFLGVMFFFLAAAAICAVAIGLWVLGEYAKAKVRKLLSPEPQKEQPK